jgi:hypothetical protein
MPNRKALAAALAALSIAAVGPVQADHHHHNLIDVLSFSWGSSLPAGTGTPSEVASPSAGKPAAMLVPAVQKVREAAAGMSTGLAPAGAARLSAGDRGSSPVDPIYMDFRGIDGRFGSDGGARLAAPAQLPPPAAPQRAPGTTDGTSSTLFHGERPPRLAPGAPTVRR